MPDPVPSDSRVRCAPPPAGAHVPALVLKVGRYALHDHGGLGVIRTLGRLGVPVYAVVEDRVTPAAVSRYLRGAFVWDTRGLDTAALLDGMRVIAERLNRPTIVIPTDDVGAILLAEEADTLRRWFLFPQQAPALPRTVANKRDLYFLCKRMGVPCPEAVFPSSAGDVRAFAASAVFPVMVKATERRADTERTAWIARTPGELESIYGALAERDGGNLMLQEYIPPSCGEDWFYHGYRNPASGCSIGFTGRKLRSHPPFAGPTTLGKAVVNEPLRLQTEALLHGLSYAGITDLDYRLDKRDGRYKLLDFNPRVGAQFRLFEGDGGIDVVRALYLDLVGREVPACRPVAGRTFIVEPYDIAAGVGYARRRALTFREWRRSLAGTRELAWFNRDDPLPFVVMCLRLLLRVVQRALGVRGAAASGGRAPRPVRMRRIWAARRPAKAA